MRANRHRENFLGGRWVLILLCILLETTTGCMTGASTRMMKSDLNFAGMYHYQKNGVDMYLSEEWEETDIPPGQQKEVKAYFKSALGNMAVMCFSSWVSNMQLQEVMMATLSPKARVYTEPTCIENYPGTFKPCYGKFKDVRVSEGEEIPVTIYLAWKGTMFGCKYGIIGSGLISEPDFVRMVSSIK
jgi:hypothetical protein